MKAFFALLLIGNIAFAVFQWLLPYEQLFSDTRKLPAAEELRLLSEANSEIIELVSRRIIFGWRVTRPQSFARSEL